MTSGIHDTGQITRTPGTETAVLAGGCFWGMEDLLREIEGVLDTEVGYCGGENENATYRNHPGHAEAVLIETPRVERFGMPLSFAAYNGGAHRVAAWLATHDDLADTVVIGGDPLLDAALARDTASGAHGLRRDAAAHHLRERLEPVDRPGDQPPA